MPLDESSPTAPSRFSPNSPPPRLSAGTALSVASLARISLLPRISSPAQPLSLLAAFIRPPAPFPSPLCPQPARPSPPRPPPFAETRRLLYALFARWGKVLDVVVMRSDSLRGRAWVVYSDVGAAAAALREAQSFPFMGRPLSLTYAVGTSSAVLQTEAAKGRRGRKARKNKAKEAERAAAASREAGGTVAGAAAAAAAPGANVGEPSRTLLLTGLPAATTASMLDMLFSQFPGFQGVRTVEARPGVAFVDFEDEHRAGVAVDGLQGFKITPEFSLAIVYARA